MKKSKSSKEKQNIRTNNTSFFFWTTANDSNVSRSQGFHETSQEIKTAFGPHSRPVAESRIAERSELCSSDRAFGDKPVPSFKPKGGSASFSRSNHAKPNVIFFWE
jgi:hypothetical protein